MYYRHKELNKMGLQLNGINSGFVTGKELEAVSSKIFQAAQAQSTTQSVDLSKIDVAKFKQIDNGTSLSGLNANNEVSKQIADMNANLQLSQQTIANLQALQSNAAIKNIDKIVEGKLTIPANVKETEASGEVFALTQSSEVLNPHKMDKDKKGSNPFVFSFTQNNDEKEETSTNLLSIFA